MAHEFTFERRVEFAETDMAGIVHFSNFFRFMEAAEHAFFRSLGLPLHRQDEQGMSGWARVHAECDYLRPLQYGDNVEVRVAVMEKGASTLGYAFDFHLPGEKEPRARGRMRVCCVGRAPGEKRMRAINMPSDVARTIDVAPRYQGASDAAE